MSDTPKQKFLDALYRKTGEQPKQTKSGLMAQCPTHDDDKASLSIGTGNDGKVLLFCHAGCSTESVCQALGLTMTDLMSSDNRSPAPKKKNSGKSRIVATYDYRDERGNLLYQALRKEPKDFLQRKPKPGGGWDWTVEGVRLVPYRLPELLADSSKPIFVVEGEKDADGLAKTGFVATCNVGGAGKWKPEYAEHLRGRDVAIIPDNDDPGRQHADDVARSLHGIARAIKVVPLPGLLPKGDVSDWLDVGGTVEQLRELIKATPQWTPAPPKPEEWPDIEPLDAVALPDFPVDALPDVLRQWVTEESHATQTPPDLAGLLSLAVCSATIAKRVVMLPRPGWIEPVNLFVAVLLDPGNRKSAVFADAVRPLKEIENELIEAARPTVAREQSERRQLESQLKRLEKQAAEGDEHARHEAGNLAAELSTATEPVLPRLILDDATSEKLGMMLADHGGRIASLSPEGGVFDLMAGLYSKSGMPQFGVYLMGHSGDDLIVDRVTRKSLTVERPALTCAYAMQPAVIEGIAGNAAFRGRGLLARFLYAAPKSWIGQREIAPRPMAPQTSHAYRDIIRTLSALDGETVLGLTDDAEMHLATWEKEIERMLADGGDMEMTRDWGGKLAGATLRLAAVLHCIKHRGPIGQIDDDTLTAAIKLGNYLIPHAEHVLNLMEASEESGDDDARYILKWIRENQLQEFSKRDAHQHGRRRFPKADDIEPGLAVLAQRGYIRLMPMDPKTLNKPGRPPSPIYEVNPALLENKKANNCTQNPHNSVSEPSEGISEDIEYTFPQSENQNRERFSI